MPTQNIQLIQIFSDEWILKKDIIKSILKNKLNQITNRVYARKCIIKDLDIHIKNTFLNENHIQGEDKSKFKYGLFFNEELVAVMTFCKSRFNSNYKWELSRFCVKQNINVIGGFSKLLSYFIKNQEGSIISYADRRLSNGNVYLKNGFTLIKENKPSYYYVNSTYEFRLNRMRFQKSLTGAINCTEYERARQLGYNKIYDCGTFVFVLNSN